MITPARLLIARHGETTAISIEGDCALRRRPGHRLLTEIVQIPTRQFSPHATEQGHTIGREVQIVHGVITVDPLLVVEALHLSRKETPLNSAKSRSFRSGVFLQPVGDLLQSTDLPRLVCQLHFRGVQVAKRSLLGGHSPVQLN